MKSKSFVREMPVYAAGALCLFSFLFSCKQETAPSPLPVDITVTGPETHTWYSLSENGYAVVDLPQNAPQVFTKPWTESVRITSAGVSGNTGYALVNRTGILSFRGDKIGLYTDAQAFGGKTADDMFFMKGKPTFLVYRNTVFGNAGSRIQGGDPVIMQFRDDTGMFYPLLSRRSLNLKDNAEVTDIYLTDGSWLGCIKLTTDKRIQFSYFKAPNLELASASGGIAGADFYMEEIDVETYRKAVQPQAFSQAPHKLRELLSAIPPDYPFYMSLCTDGGSQIMQYVQEGQEADVLQGSAVIGDTWAAAVFADGTAYFTGAAEGRAIPRRGPKTAFRLPKLPAGYVYGSFTVSGDYMYVAWEQTDFYKTGKSGFIAVDLGKVLYEDKD